jgi:hypothetical protein
MEVFFKKRKKVMGDGAVTYRYMVKNWETVATHVPGRDKELCLQKWYNLR